MNYHYSTTVKMYDTDAAGIIYFASQFRFAHDAFESMLDREGFRFQKFFTELPYFFVIVHAESDYYSSLYIGDCIDVSIKVAKIGKTSATMESEIFRDGELMGRVQTVHVCVDKQTRKKQLIPDEMLRLLEKFS